MDEMANIGLQKGSGKRLKVREKSVKSLRISKLILSGNPVMENWENPIDYTVYFVFKVHAMNVIFLLVFVLVLVDFDLLLQHLQQQQIAHTTMTISATAPAIPPIMPPFLKINKHSLILICNRGRRVFCQ